MIRKILKLTLILKVSLKFLINLEDLQINKVKLFYYVLSLKKSIFMISISLMI